MISISLISVFSTLQVKIAQMFSFNLNFFAPECSAETPYITKWIGYLVPCAIICKNESVIVELRTTAKWSKTRPWRIMESNDWLIRHTCFGQKRERKKNPHGFFHSGHPIFHDHALKRCLCDGLHLHPSRLGTRGALKPGSVWNGASLALAAAWVPLCRGQSNQKATLDQRLGTMYLYGSTGLATQLNEKFPGEAQEVDLRFVGFLWC